MSYKILGDKIFNFLDEEVLRSYYVEDVWLTPTEGFYADGSPRKGLGVDYDRIGEAIGEVIKDYVETVLAIKLDLT